MTRNSFSSAVLILLLALPGALSAREGSLPDGFKGIRFGMSIEEMRKAVPQLTEDLAHQTGFIEAYQSFGFPNNGYSEFRLFEDQLFYIHVTITSSEMARLLLTSFRNKYGEPSYHGRKAQSDRYMWKDDKAVLAVSIYPFHIEIRVKSLIIEQEIRSFEKSDAVLDQFIDEGLKEIFKDKDATMEEKQRIFEIKKAREKK